MNRWPRKPVYGPAGSPTSSMDMSEREAIIYALDSIEAVSKYVMELVDRIEKLEAKIVYHKTNGDWPFERENYRR